MKDLLSWGVQFPELQATFALIGAVLTVLLGVHKAIGIFCRWRNPPPEPLEIAAAAAHIALHGPPPSQTDKKTVADYDRIIAERNNDAGAYIGRARLLAVNDELDLAISDYSEAIRIKLSMDALLERADVHMRKGDVDSAVSDLNSVLAMDPQSAPTLTRLSRAHTTKGEFKRAIARADDALKLNPASADAFAERAAARIQLQEFDAAIVDAATQSESIHSITGDTCSGASIQRHRALQRSASCVRRRNLNRSKRA